MELRFLGEECTNDVRLSVKFTRLQQLSTSQTYTLEFLHAHRRTHKPAQSAENVQQWSPSHTLSGRRRHVSRALKLTVFKVRRCDWTEAVQQAELASVAQRLCAASARDPDPTSRPSALRCL